MTKKSKRHLECIDSNCRYPKKASKPPGTGKTETFRSWNRPLSPVILARFMATAAHAHAAPTPALVFTGIQKHPVAMFAVGALFYLG